MDLTTLQNLKRVSTSLVVVQQHRNVQVQGALKTWTGIDLRFQTAGHPTLEIQTTSRFTFRQFSELS